MKIVIELSDEEELELTIDEARELKKQLNEIFTEEKTVYVVKKDGSGETTWPQRPYYPYYPVITCTAGTVVPQWTMQLPTNEG